MSKLAEVYNALEYHKMEPGSPKQEKFETLRKAAMDLAHVIDEQTPESREQSLAYTHLEETLMWAIKSVAIRE